MNRNLSFSVSGQRIEMTEAAMLVAGTVNEYTASFFFSEEWEGYQKTAVFSCDTVSREQLLTDDACKVPWEVLVAREYLRFGVYGTKSDGSRLPTIWTKQSLFINSGAVPTKEAAEPSPTLVEQLMARMGDLDSLKTTDKSSLVAAINEIYASGGGSGGASVTEATINEDGHLIITLSTGETIDAGYAVGPAGKDAAVDATLTQSGQAADAAVVGERLDSLSEDKVNMPKDESGVSQNGTDGQILQTNGDGTTQWVDKPTGGGGVSGDYIPVPSTAEVGQTIVVKAVDESGKPTEWEAVDMASGWTELYHKTFEQDEDIYPQIEITGFQSSYDEFELEMHLSTVNNIGNAVCIYINGTEKWVGHTAKQTGDFSTLFKVKIVGKYALIVAMNAYGESVASSSITGANFFGSGCVYLSDGIISSIGYKSYGFNAQAGSIVIVRAK